MTSAKIAQVGVGVVCGGIFGLVVGLMLEQLTSPQLANWVATAGWGAGLGLVAGLMCSGFPRPVTSCRNDAITCGGAFAAGLLGFAVLMAAGASVGMALFDAGIERAFVTPDSVRPRLQTMARGAWELRHAAAAFGFILFAWALCRSCLSCRWHSSLAALGLVVMTSAVAVMAAPVYRAFATPSHSSATDHRSVLALMHKVAVWQLKHPRHGPTEWHNCPWHEGLLALHRASGEPRYLDHLMRMGEVLHWQLGPQPWRADDYCIGGVYMDLFRKAQDARLIEATRAHFDALRATPRPGREEWWLCDALFFGPPVLARLSAVTGRPEYVDVMDAMFWDAVQYLYDPVQRLFHRDDAARKEAQAAGRPRFWGRGNAWVLAGLARTLQWLPADHPSRNRYVALFRDMAQALLPMQQQDGFWRSSLLDLQLQSSGESSGTALFTYALAWGVNEGLLSAGDYMPAVLRAWAALCGAVTEEGRLGWVQPEAREPGIARRFDWETYGSGALLLAGAELLRSTTPGRLGPAQGTARP
jgi:rhamnogalacturonyl hydrolase YesR